MNGRALILTAALGFSPAAFGAGAMSVSQEIDAEYVYVGGANTRGAGLNVGSVDENSADLKYVFSPQITKDLLLRFGVEWHRLSFGISDRAPVPGVLQQISTVLGFDYQLAEQWLVRLEVQPGVYANSGDVRWDNLDAPLVFGAAYLKDPDVQWFFGLRLDVRSQYPILPAVGVRWKFSDEWTLNFALPNPRLEYDVNEHLIFYGDAGLSAGTYRVGESFGARRGLPQLDNAVLDYLEIRLGVGVSWKILPNMTIDAGAGYLPYRSFDFFGRDIVFRSHNAPCGQLACHTQF
jgi:opacity protein-like surface antigen